MTRIIFFALLMLSSCNRSDDRIISSSPPYLPIIRHEEIIKGSETFDMHGPVSRYKAIRYWGKYQPDGSIKTARIDTLTFWCDYGLATPHNYEWWKESKLKR